MRRFRAIALLILLVAAWAWIELRKEPPERTITAADGSAVHIIDGDSLRIDGREIRIAGIDAPEYRQSCGDGKGGSWDCGKAARDELVRLAGTGGLACDTRHADRYGRLLATCRSKAGDIGKAMALAGLAIGAGDKRFTEPSAEIAAAQKAKRGIWRGPHQRPADWRRAHAGS